MGEQTKISWTDHTFNPWKGCTKVSAECDNCYAERETNRYGLNVWGNDAPRPSTSSDYWRQPFKWDKKAAEAGVRRRVFCGSWCDVMEDYPAMNDMLNRLRGDLFAVIRATPTLDWILVTKRPQNFRRFLPPDWLDKPRPNVWGLTTVGTYNTRWRIDALRTTPFHVRGLSCEPLLEDIAPLDLTGIQWVIVGGESGPGARPMHPNWARRLRDQAVRTGSKFHFKQWGEWAPLGENQTFIADDDYMFPDGIAVRRVGKHAAGRLLDGREWNQFPFEEYTAAEIAEVIR